MRRAMLKVKLTRVKPGSRPETLVTLLLEPRLLCPVKVGSVFTSHPPPNAHIYFVSSAHDPGISIGHALLFFVIV